MTKIASLSEYSSPVNAIPSSANNSESEINWDTDHCYKAQLKRNNFIALAVLERTISLRLRKLKTLKTIEMVCRLYFYKS